MRKSPGNFIITSLIILLFSSILFIDGCAKGQSTSKSDASKSSTKTILIASHTTLSGPLADVGQAAKFGAELAIQDLGTFKLGNTSYQVKMFSVDDEGDLKLSAERAQDAVDKGVIAVIGAMTSGNTAAAQPVYARANIPMISPSATQSDLTDQSYTNFFRTCLRDDIQGKVLAQWAAQLGLKRITVMDDNGDYGQKLGDTVEETLIDEGIEVDRQHTVDDKQINFDTQISKIKEFDSQAVIFTAYHRQAGLLRQQMIDKDLDDVLLIGGDGIKSDMIFEEAGGAQNMEGSLCTFGLDRSKMQTFGAYKDKYSKISNGQDPGPYSENAYDALGVVIAAIKKSRDTDGQKLIDELHKIKYTGILGTFSFSEKGDIEIPGSILKFIAKDGKWVPFKAEQFK